MSDRITDARKGLETLLYPYRVAAVRPEKVQAPMIIVEAQDPYVQPGQSYEDLTLYVTLTCIVSKGSNALVTGEVNETIIDVVEAIRGAWTLESASVGMLTVSDFDYASATINLKTNI